MAAKKLRQAPSNEGWRHRLEEAMRISYLVYDALPPTHPVHQAFKALDEQRDAAFNADDLDEQEDRVLCGRAVRAALESFYGLPEADQRSILRGWRPVRARPTRRQTIAAESAVYADGDLRGALQRVLVVGGGRAADDGAVKLWTHQEFVLDECTAPVLVRVVEGTSRDDVVRSLLAIADRLLTTWDELVDAVP